MTSDLRALPRTVEAIGDGFLGIIWADGHESVYPAEYLRDACPCAACNERRREAPARAAAALGASLPVIGQAGAGGPVTFDRHETVGRYALRFSWSDRHDTGIFTFELLRALCPCEACEAARRQAPR
jgi:DUF971 family protein